MKIDDSVNGAFVIRRQVAIAQWIGWIERGKVFRCRAHRAERSREHKPILAFERDPGRIDRGLIEKAASKERLRRQGRAEAKQTGESEKSTLHHGDNS